MAAYVSVFGLGFISGFVVLSLVEMALKGWEDRER